MSQADSALPDPEPPNKTKPGTRHDGVSGVEEDSEEQSVNEATRLSARLIYEVVRRDGEEELSRPTSSLIWSGIAGGHPDQLLGHRRGAVPRPPARHSRGAR